MSRSFDGYILTGGAGSRIGADKASLEVGGRTILERVAAALTPNTRQIFTVGGEKRYRHIEHVSDRLPRGAKGEKSSIAGLYSALRHAETEWVLVAACDTPFITVDLVRFLSGRTDEGIAAVVPLSSDGTPQPLCGAYRVRDCVHHAENAIIRNQLSLRALLDEFDTKIVRFDELRHLPGAENFFLNVNTPEDLAAAQKTFRAIVD